MCGGVYATGDNPGIPAGFVAVCVEELQTGRRPLLHLALSVQAGSGVRRRAALLRRWRAVRDLPPPRVVVLVLKIPSPDPGGGGSSAGVGLSKLAAIQKTAAAAAALGAATLLAVAADEPMGPGARVRLSYTAGLHGRPGAVVPLVWRPGPGGGLRVATLQAAILGHAAAQGGGQRGGQGKL